MPFVCREFSARALERDDIDIVDIMTPGHLHAEIAIAALAAGKHVIVEKPLANSLEQAIAMAEAAAAAGANGQRAIVNFNYRRVPAIALARVPAPSVTSEPISTYYWHKTPVNSLTPSIAAALRQRRRPAG